MNISHQVTPKKSKYKRAESVEKKSEPRLSSQGLTMNRISPAKTAQAKTLPVNPSPTKEIPARQSLTYDNGDSQETKDLRLECERMKTSILILNK